MKALDGKKRIADLDNATRQLHQLSCILDSCTISASYEVSQAQKALLLLPRTEKKDLARLQKKLTKYILPTYRIFLMKTSGKSTRPYSRLMIDKAHVSGL